jgi:hypothetical protein
VLYVYRNIGTVTSPSFQYYPDYFKIIKLNGGSATVSLKDYDGDGDKDLLSGDWLGKFNYFRNDGTPLNQSSIRLQLVFKLTVSLTALRFLLILIKMATMTLFQEHLMGRFFFI